MVEKLSFHIAHTENQAELSPFTRLEVRGYIDEDAVFPELDAFPHRAVCIDFQGLRGINSCGIREWVQFAGLLAQSHDLRVQHCPAILVEQLNAIIDFLPKGTILESVFVPHYCPKCDQEEQILVVLSDYLSAERQIDKRTCQHCPGVELLPDCSLESYFYFLKSMKSA